MSAIIYKLFFLQILAVISALVHGEGGLDESCAQIPIKARVECDLPSAGMDRCIRRGCCYDSSTPGSIQCFSHQHKAVCRCSEVKPEDRQACGSPGTTFEQCRTMGCCYDPSVSGAPPCFVKPYEKTLAIEEVQETQLEENGYEEDCSKCKSKKKGIIGTVISGIFGSGESELCKKCKEKKTKHKKKGGLLFGIL
ncbi:uncharacterized protein O3C94_001379 [Discoglossus pictus]